MTFIWPAILFLLLLLPLLAAIYLRLQRRRRRAAATYGSLGFMQQAAGTGRVLGARRHIPPVLFMLGLTILVFALARPQTVLSLPKVAGTVILAFDVSGSMGADDMKPTRMDAAKIAARDFVQRQPLTVQIGVVAFSDSGFSVQAPTNEKDAIYAAIDRLTPQRGTSVAHGIEAALKTISAGNGETTHLYSNLTPVPTPSPTPMPKGTYTPAAIVLLSDGENNESPDPLVMAQTAADRGVRIYTVGIGSAAGTNVKINGFSIHTQLDEQTLQQIAQVTGAAYYNAETEQDLRAIYDTLGAQLVVKAEKTEVTAVFAGAGIVVLLIGGLLSMLWFSRVP